MKYEAPLGQSDPNAAYINANKAAGISGSIPPAESIEYPMREVVNLIDKSGQTPSDADLFQLTRGVRGGQLNYCQDVGASANNLAVAMDPPLAAYQAGLRLFVKAAHSCSGPGCVIAVDSLPLRAVKRADGSELQAADFVAGQIVCLVDDGTSFQMQNYRGTGGAGGGTATYVVNIPYCHDTSPGANQLVASFTPAITAL